MREVGGDAVLARPREDVDALADALASLAEDPAVYAERSRLVWARAAQLLLGPRRCRTARADSPSILGPPKPRGGPRAPRHAVLWRHRPPNDRPCRGRTGERTRRGPAGPPDSSRCSRGRPRTRRSTRSPTPSSRPPARSSRPTPRTSSPWPRERQTLRGAPRPADARRAADRVRSPRSGARHPPALPEPGRRGRARLPAAGERPADPADAGPDGGGRDASTRPGPTSRWTPPPSPSRAATR